MALHVPFPDTPVLVHLLCEPSGEASARGTEPSAQVGYTPHVPDGPPETEAHADLYGRLTSRELEVVRLLAAGETGRSIGGRLHLSGHTVENHIRNAREKLHAATRLDLVLTAQRLGLVQDAGTSEYVHNVDVKLYWRIRAITEPNTRCVYAKATVE